MSSPETYMQTTAGERVHTINAHARDGLNAVTVNLHLDRAAGPEDALRLLSSVILELIVAARVDQVPAQIASAP